MTEQEKRGKAIEEMAVKASNCCECGCGDCPMRPCTVYEYSERVYDAGYRKEEEVQKETARQFAKLLLKKFDKNCQGHTFYRDDIKRILKKEFGVEVEE